MSKSNLCPSCQKLATRIVERIPGKDGAKDVVTAYCGACGGNWPAPAKKGAAA